MEFLQEEIISISSPESVCSFTDANTEISMYENIGQEAKEDLWMIFNPDATPDEPFLNSLLDDLDFSWLSSNPGSELQDINTLDF